MDAPESAARISSSPASYWRSLAGTSPVAAPVAFLYVFDLFFAHPKKVANLVNQRLTDRHHEVVLILSFTLVRSLKDQDAVGQGVAVVPSPFSERRSLVQAEQRVGRLDLHVVE